MMIRLLTGGGAILMCSTPGLAAGEHGGGAVQPSCRGCWHCRLDVGYLRHGRVRGWEVRLGTRSCAWVCKGVSEYIFQSLEQAKQEREAAQATHREYVEQLQTAQTQASAIVEEGRRDALVLRGKIEEQAKANADAALERAKREIALATDNAVKELYTLSATLATEVASRVIEKEIDAGTHERLIAESIEEIGRLHQN